LVALGVLLVPLAAAGATRSGKTVQVSHCPGPPNAEVVQAVDGRYVYEAWIGCRRSIGFARSVDGGKTFGPSRPVRGSSPRNGLHAWDPSLAIGPDGSLYVAYMVGPGERTFSSSAPMNPVVAVSHDHGRSFDRVSTLPVPTTRNWGDRPFIAVDRGGAVYVTWDYGPRRDETRVICPPTSSCYFSAGDFNAVIQSSPDGGRTWTKVAPISPGFPLGGVYSAPIVAEPDGALDVLYWQHPTDSNTLRVSPGFQYFTRSTDGGKTWSTPIAVGSKAGTIGLKTWWIDGSLAFDRTGTIYAAWDTQRAGRDTAWLSWSTNGGKRWTAPLQVASSRTEHLTQVAAAGSGSVYVAWQTIVGRKGYATFIRRYTLGKGWTSRALNVSPAYGKPKVWPGDTFGLSAKGDSAILSWGSAIKERAGSEIYSTTATLPAR
jgi:hypothetical protein